jgi:hypothetical protein
MGVFFPLTLSMFLVFSWGCAEPEFKSKAPVEHMKRTKEFKDVFHKINNIHSAVHMTELERDELRIMYAKRFVEAGMDVASTLKMRCQTNKHYPTYKEKADELQQRLALVDGYVKTYTPEKIEPAMNYAMEVCKSCHALYRKKKD